MLLIISLLGLLCGSFINAAVWRLHLRIQKPGARSQNKQAGLKTPNTEHRKPDYSLLSGRSVCPQCRHQLAAADLIPIASWLWLKGRCRYCHKPISAQYPIVELLTAGLFAWSYLRWDFNGLLSQLDLGVWLMMLVGLIILAVYDLRWMILPNAVIYPLIVLAVVHLGLRVAMTGSGEIISSNLLAAAVAGLFFYSLYVVGRGRWMGGGDVKLALLMGLLLGSGRTLVAMFIGFNVAALVSLILMAARRLKRQDLIPFGPFLIGATIVSMLYGAQFFNAYIDYFVSY
ncbi:prepilin peptidase [Candidatus Microgenomates bacterium]|nr:prepilin peptidase [Candidatus Microgenomates bacterium]